MESNKGKNNVLFLGIVAVVIASAMISAKLFKNRSTALAGSMAPEIQINQWITPNPPTQSDLNGQVYVLEFWATWCPPCVRAIPHTIELVKKYKNKVHFIALSVDNSSKPVKKMVKDRGINYHVGMDNGLAGKYSVRSIPSAFIIDRRGQIVWQGHPSSSDFESAIVNALNAPIPAE